MNRTRDAEFGAYVQARGRARERFAYVLTGDAHRAQDLVQTTLLKAYLRWDRIVEFEHPDAGLALAAVRDLREWRPPVMDLGTTQSRSRVASLCKTFDKELLPGWPRKTPFPLSDRGFVITL